VITTEEHTLVLIITNGPSSDPLEYGSTEFIQVHLDGAWYTIKPQLPQREEPLRLDPHPNYARSIGHIVDLSPLGGLPPGRYRIVEKFYYERLKSVSFASAYFWIIEPGGERPPESEITGEARLGDIVLSAESLSGARRQITDADNIINMVIENLSGKRYFMENATLEMKNGLSWEKVEFQHANLGMIMGWHYSRNQLFLNEPLATGQYRLRVSMRTDMGTVAHECVFTVIALKDALEPKWERSQLSPSTYDAEQQSTSARMSTENPRLNNNNTTLNIQLSADCLYCYGSGYSVDVLLGEKWYTVPFTFGYFTSEARYIDQYDICSETIHPVFAFGVLPAGQYRVVKVFNLCGPDTLGGGITYLAKEFAIAEFTVEETLDWLVLS